MQAEDIDLVLVSIDTDPPVAKLVNYSKLKYEVAIFHCAPMQG